MGIIEHKRGSTLGQGRGNCLLNLGLASQIFQDIGAKRSVLWPSKYAKTRFRPGTRPGLRWGSAPDLVVIWEGDTILPPSALATKIRCLCLAESGAMALLSSPPPNIFL